jgi:hypothetical protein
MNGSNATNNTQGGRQGFPFLFRFCSIFVPLNVDFCCVFAVVFCSDSAPILLRRRFPQTPIFQGFHDMSRSANSAQTQRRKFRIKIESKLNQKSPKFPLILMAYKKPADAGTSADRCHEGDGEDNMT